MRIILFLLILTSYSFANIKEVKIFGNKRVSSSTIEALVEKKTLKLIHFISIILRGKFITLNFFLMLKLVMIIIF